MRFSCSKTSSFKHRSDQFVIESQHFIKKLTVLDVIAFLISVKLHVIRYHLFIGNIFKHKEIRLVFVIKIVRLRPICLIEKSISSSMRTRHRRIDSPVGNGGRVLSDRSRISAWLNSFEFVF